MVNRSLEMGKGLHKAHFHPKKIQALTLISIWHEINLIISRHHRLIFNQILLLLTMETLLITHHVASIDQFPGSFETLEFFLASPCSPRYLGTSTGCVGLVLWKCVKSVLGHQSQHFNWKIKWGKKVFLLGKQKMSVSL